jgi:hypothetical protein
LERESGLVSRFETSVMPDGGEETLRYVERIVKFLLWSRGGWKLQIGGPKAIGTFIRKTYSPRGERKFDIEMMELAYGKKFEVEITTAGEVYAARDMELPVGGHMKGCRIGFDLGASDFKVSAVIDGEAVFTEETPWDPKTQADPGYHYHNISAALHRAGALCGGGRGAAGAPRPRLFARPAHHPGRAPRDHHAAVGRGPARVGPFARAARGPLLGAAAAGPRLP